MPNPYPHSEAARAEIKQLESEKQQCLILMVDQFMYEQKVTDSSDWSYQGVHYPHAA